VRIATGHTADDQAETVVMRLLEGAGPRGLGAIAPVRGPFIRPLLETTRRDVLGYLRARGLAWIEDASNADLRFKRNRVRHEVMPALVGAFGPGVVDSLCRSAALSRALVADLDRQARSALLQFGRKTSCGFVFPIHQLETMPTELAAQTIAAAARELGESRSWRAASHLALRRVLLPGATTAAIRLGSLCAERSGSHLRVGPTVLAPLRTRHVHAPAKLDLAELGLRLEARCLARTAEWVVPRGTHHVAFDADLMPEPLIVRARRPGDRFAPFGEPGEHRLKSFLIAAGIPRWERERTPLLEAAGHIAWVAGIRRGQIATVRAETARILEVTLHRL
jgi:tRNA(Ile)-lysidine synthase